MCERAVDVAARLAEHGIVLEELPVVDQVVADSPLGFARIVREHGMSPAEVERDRAARDLKAAKAWGFGCDVEDRERRRVRRATVRVARESRARCSRPPGRRRGAGRPRARCHRRVRASRAGPSDDAGDEPGPGAGPGAGCLADRRGAALARRWSLVVSQLRSVLTPTPPSGVGVLRGGSPVTHWAGFGHERCDDAAVRLRDARAGGEQVPDARGAAAVCRVAVPAARG